MKSSIQIFGGGPAGLFTAHFARKAGYNFSLFESSGMTGGNCRTIHDDGFYYDTGAHRLHAVDGELKEFYMDLLKDDLLPVDAPSRIFLDGRHFKFPLAPLNIVRNFSSKELLYSIAGLLKRKAMPAPGDSFKSVVYNTYGDFIADKFLTGYSEKLWGVSCDELHPEVAGKRLKGLDLSTFIREAFRTDRSVTRHIDGKFFYPKNGIGQLFDNLFQSIDQSSVYLNSPVNEIFYDGNKINSFVVNSNRTFNADQVVSTLPVNVLLRSLRPAPPDEIFELMNKLRFRYLILVHIKLERSSVTSDATVYMPSYQTRVTRLTEPRNRSITMTPPGTTSLVAEVPCFPEDEIWKHDDNEICDSVMKDLLQTSMFKACEVIGMKVTRLPFAYPVLTNDFRHINKKIMKYLGRFENLAISGRSGLFRYSHIHDHYYSAKEIIEGLERID